MIRSTSGTVKYLTAAFGATVTDAASGAVAVATAAFGATTIDATATGAAAAATAAFAVDNRCLLGHPPNSTT